VAKLFFLISGEHDTLPVSEVEAILKAEGIAYRISERLTQVLRLETDTKTIEQIRRRSALTRVCCQEIFNCEAKLSEILDNIKPDVLGNFIDDESFAVRVRRVKGASPKLVRADLEGELGGKILQMANKSRVNLSNPQKTFIGVLTDNRFIFGLERAEISPKQFSERRPRRKPFFHPTAMPAKLARTMVNLAQPKSGELLLDPFCGTGGMLVEAGLIGCHVVGFDAKPHMLRGGLKNLRHYEVTLEGLAIADARYPPITRVDCVVTDPPYGRSASTLGTETRLIVEDFLSAIGDILPIGAKICMASPEKIHIGETAKEAGFRHLESHFVYVHRSLTREIVVFERR
jgi:tRNA (guanine10-N2)-dimethyltransferase